ncbi:unnamed protein product [Polarella glacialis]|uniref:AMP-dependent synthetase/ligase domain-containing protein n=1 Tax=Polarella glacialis TaxID=89957 RepID=A0A813L574_POLGL|nr:unnamed protein product [Polarella glacialis]
MLPLLGGPLLLLACLMSSEAADSAAPQEVLVRSNAAGCPSLLQVRAASSAQVPEDPENKTDGVVICADGSSLKWVFKGAVSGWWGCVPLITWNHFWPNNSNPYVFTSAWCTILGMVCLACARGLLESWVGVASSRNCGKAAGGKSAAWSSCQGPQVDIPEKRVDELVALKAAAAGELLALIDDGTMPLCYGELEQRIAALSQYMRDPCGVRAGDRVGVLVPRGFAELIAPLAANRAGAAFCNLDEAADAAQLERYCKLLQPVVVVCGSVAMQDLLPPGVQSFLIRPDASCESSPWQHRGTRCPSIDVAASAMQTTSTMETPAAVWFTSGSTGEPKAVVWDHKMLTHNNFSTARLLGLSSTDVMLLKTTNIWAAWEYEAFPALISGAALRVTRPGGNKDPEYLAELLLGGAALRPVTCATFTSQVLGIVLDRLEKEGGLGAQQPAAQLRHVIQVGERCPAALGDRVGALLPHVVLHNLWGCTECACTVFSASGVGLKGHGVGLDPGAGLPGGQPEPQVLVRLLDAQRREVAPGQEGFIYVGGIVAKGYLGRDDLTAAKFLDDPTGSGVRMFDTGDLGKVDDRGQLHILGRRDRQLKLRGIRIEPEGVEAALCKFPGVQRAAVVATSDPAVLHGFVEVAASFEDASEEALLGHCEMHLPPHMRPHTISVFQAPGGLPQLPNGKANLKALEHMAAAKVGSAEKPVVDSLGLLRRVSKRDLPARRILDNVLVLSTCAMVHFHMNYCSPIAGDREKVSPEPWFQTLVLGDWNIDSEWSSLGFVVAGSLAESMDSGPPRFGLREILVLYVYLLWQGMGLAVGFSTGYAWYLLMLLLCKVALVGMHRLKMPVLNQLVVVCCFPFAFQLSDHLQTLSAASPAFQEFSQLINLQDVMNSCKASDAAFYCAVFLLSPCILRSLRAFAARSSALTGLVAALLGAAALNFQCQHDISWPLSEAADLLVLILFASALASLPETCHWEFVAKNSLGSYVFSSVWSACVPGIPGFQKAINGLNSLGGNLAAGVKLAGMAFNIAACCFVFGPLLQRLLLMPLHALPRLCTKSNMT